MRRSTRPIVTSALLALAGLASAAPEARAQATPQGSAQAYASMQSPSCYCAYPQGYCPFPQGYCAVPNPCLTPMGSPQGASPQSATPQGYTPVPYGTPTPYRIKPLGIPMNSMPSSQGVMASGLGGLSNTMGTPFKMIGD